MCRVSGSRVVSCPRLRFESPTRYGGVGGGPRGDGGGGAGGPKQRNATHRQRSSHHAAARSRRQKSRPSIRRRSALHSRNAVRRRVPAAPRICLPPHIELGFTDGQRWRSTIHRHESGFLHVRHTACQHPVVTASHTHQISDTDASRSGWAALSLSLISRQCGSAAVQRSQWAKAPSQPRLSSS